MEWTWRWFQHPRHRWHGSFGPSRSLAEDHRMSEGRGGLSGKTPLMDKHLITSPLLQDVARIRIHIYIYKSYIRMINAGYIEDKKLVSPSKSHLKVSCWVVAREALKLQLVDCARVPVLTVWSGDHGRFQKLKHGQRGVLSSHSIKPNDAKCSMVCSIWWKYMEVQLCSKYVYT